MNHLEGLNARQREAVEHTEGPLLIVAGAGAGKTRVITHRIMHLIRRGVPSRDILAITFTNKAAKEMRDRVSHLLNYQLPTTNYQLPFISTFHALGVHIIRENSHRLGLTRHFTIFDRSDSISAVKEAIRRSDKDPRDFEPGKLLSAISREKGNMARLDAYRERASGDYSRELIAEVWTEYEKLLREAKALDFDDLLLSTALLLQGNASVREQYQKRWRYLHIDEYQDTNYVQYMLAKLLTGEQKNIAVVGDGDQNIYQWRGATIKNILHFEKDYPNAKVVLLEENYRSTQTILAAANEIIKKNKLRVDKTLYTKNPEGEKLGLYTAYDEQDEAAFIALKAKVLIESGTEPREIAVLFRANFQSRVLEEAFLNADVPYQVLGTRFFERKEVKDIVSYVRVSLNPDSLADMRRIINVPPRGIGKVTLLKIFAGQEASLTPAVKEKLASFRKLLAALKTKLLAEPLSSTLKWIVTASGLEQELKKGGADDEERLENIKELVTFAVRYDSMDISDPFLTPAEAEVQNTPSKELDSRLRGNDRLAAVNQFLSDVVLQSDQDELKEEKNAVRLMTVHASKGLEFEQVFIAGLEQGLFPHEKIGENALDAGALEEERRLFYVALTRAKKKVFLSYAGVRTLFGSRQVTMPSEFIFDIDEDLLETSEVPINE